jgi:hypothetical protein
MDPEQKGPARVAQYSGARFLRIYAALIPTLLEIEPFFWALDFPYCSLFFRFSAARVVPFPCTLCLFLRLRG